MSGRVDLIVKDGVAEVRLERPEKRNALNAPMFEGLLAAADAIEADGAVRAVVLCGSGEAFCAGLDMGAFAAMAQGQLDAESAQVQEAGRDLSAQGANRAQQLGWRWQEIPQPVIAAVHGAAMGGGFHVALGADIRLVAPDARIAFVEIGWGLVPDLSGTQALRRLVPLDVAKKLILTGETISGERACALHLCTEVAADPYAAAMDLAHRLARQSPDAVRAAKRLLNDSGLVEVAEGLAAEFRASSALMGTPNQVEAIRARMEGRPAAYANPR